jgi:hypothetical protein
MDPRLGPSAHGEKWSVQARLLDEDVSPQLLQALVSPRGEGHGGGARLAGCPRSGGARWVSLLADPDVCGAHSALQEPSLGALARVITAGACREARCTRGKGEAGMDADQVRTWEGWHPHRALTLISVWCVIEDTHWGLAVDTRLDPPARALWGARPADGDVLCAQPPLDLSPRAAPRQAPRVGPLFPSCSPSLWTTKAVTERPPGGLPVRAHTSPLTLSGLHNMGPGWHLRPRAVALHARGMATGVRAGGAPRVSLWQAMGCRRTS